MAFTKAQLEALKNSLLASNQPITAATHRAFVQNIIDELYDAQSRGNLLAGVQGTTSNVTGDVTVVIRGGQAYLIPTANLVAAGLTFDDLNGVVIVDPQNGELLAYNATTDTWENVPNIYIPYAGATANVTLGEFGLTAGFIKLDTTPTGTPTEQGTMSWDVDNETVDVVLNGYTMKIGEDLFYPVKNQTGSNIPKGTAVRFAGTVGSSSRLLIAPFIADGSQPSTRFMGVTAEAIANGENGKVLWFGRLRGINTNAFNEGDILYASTTSAGAFQTALPAPPNNIIEIAAVVTKSINQGVIFIRPQFLSGADPNKVSYNAADLKNATEKNQARVNIGSTSATPQTIATAGVINNLAVTSNNLVFTGASVLLTGIVAGQNGEEITISNNSGSNLSLVGQSPLSSVNNRFLETLLIPNQRSVRIKYQAVENRWVVEFIGIINVPVSTMETITSSDIATVLTQTQNTVVTYPFVQTINRAAPVGTIYSFEYSFDAVYQTASNNYSVSVTTISAVFFDIPLNPTAVSFPNNYLVKVTSVRLSDKWVTTITVTGGSSQIDARTDTVIVTSTTFTGTVTPSMGIRTPNSAVTSGDRLRFHYFNRLL
jgi:hypothetical protein